MAHFRAVIKGSRGEASRLGSKASGIDSKVSGWNGGVRVKARNNPMDGQDVFHIEATMGSSGGDDRTPGGYLGFVDSDGAFHPSPELIALVRSQEDRR
jgi:hypothetical protein